MPFERNDCQQSVALRSCWAPTLAGSAAERAHEAIVAIAIDVERRLDRARSELAGYSGYALLYAYLSRVYGDHRYVALSEECHARAITHEEEHPSFPALYGGFIGLAWVDAHLSRTFFDAEEGGDADSDVDDVLDSMLQANAWRPEYDLISGLVGYGVYALERLPRSARARGQLKLLVDRLDERAEERDGGSTWHTPPASINQELRGQYPNGYYNLGVAHGVPGIVALLALMLDAGFSHPRLRPMLDGAVDWISRQRQPPDPQGPPTSFPSWRAPDGTSSPSRAAWCYGDPGIAATLILAARATHDGEWEQLAVDVGLRVAARSVGDCRVNDGGLCHGAAGLALIFMRLHAMTSEPAFAKAAGKWLDHLLTLRKPGTGVGGYQSWGPPRGANGMAPDATPAWVDDPGFLTGSVGMALTLLAATSTVSPEWDRLLLLS